MTEFNLFEAIGHDIDNELTRDDLKKSLEIASNNVVSLADTLIKELQYRQNIEKVTERLVDAALVVGDAL